jgi:signal transduction histidine kinase
MTSAYRARVATLDGTLNAFPGSGDGGQGHLSRAGTGAAWWRDWFGPAQGRRPRALDVLIAVVIAVIQVAGTGSYSQDEPIRWSFDAFAVILLLIGPAALPFRRRWPEATLAVAFLAAAGYVATGYPRGPAGYPAFLFALVSALMMGRRGFAWGVLAVAYPAFLGLTRLLPDEVEQARSVASTLGDLAYLPLVGAVTEIARVRLERRAERAHAQREEARRRAGEERMLIAREIHDVLAHTISLINVQSGVALHLLDERPDQARPALEAINDASDQALLELRSVLDVLHAGLGGNGVVSESGERAPRAPTAGLRDVEGLVRRTRAAGLAVELVVDGEVRPVPAGADLAAYRIVQEALTNVVRHAGTDVRATVRLTYAPAELVVQIDDDGQGAGEAPAAAGPGEATAAGLPGATAGGAAGAKAGGAGVRAGVPVDGWTSGDAVTGRGIAGMRERVRALGGTFAAGPRPGRGFRVRVELPLGARS